MSDTDVIESFNNAWRALAKQHSNDPDEATRVAINLLSKIIGKVESEVSRSREVKQITIDDWMKMLEAGL